MSEDVAETLIALAKFVGVIAGWFFRFWFGWWAYTYYVAPIFGWPAITLLQFFLLALVLQTLFVEPGPWRVRVVKDD